ncbi:hypothetical protein QYE76_024205 [Lolium multiflorum]|uniref:Uncharacterized protein n=1 Tax=Lolium multiflorum TaxID=4521 RepID=A0AAD8RG78_LOLMU|nr:hypothetical protein QYE76_024205 [Lolium multiflorum]
MQVLVAFRCSGGRSTTKPSVHGKGRKAHGKGFSHGKELFAVHLARQRRGARQRQLNPILARSTGRSLQPHNTNTHAQLLALCPPRVRCRRRASRPPPRPSRLAATEPDAPPVRRPVRRALSSLQPPPPTHVSAAASPPRPARQAPPPARRPAPRRCFEVDTGGGVARLSEGASRIFLEVDTGGVAGSLRGVRIFFADSLTRQGYFEVDTNGDGQKRQTTIAKNILRYLPVLPRIQRLFMTEDTAQQIRWAVEGIRSDSGKMIHPSDGTAWKNFVKKYPLKAGDPRSVAIAISTDGFNPYGPKYPGKNMNVYLEPLIDDLLLGWEDRGIRTYDAAKKEHFDMPPPPNKDDYRRVDPSTKSVDFYQEEGLPGHFTIDLSAVDNMVVDDEQEGDAVMDEDNKEYEAEDVCAVEDLSLLEAFKAGLDLAPNGPPPGFIDDYWFAEPDDDDETCGPITDVDIGY